MILVAGPYRSGTGDDPAKMQSNVAAMEALALPLVALAGSTRVGDAAFTEIFHPIAERLVERCDGLLRIGGPSAGADEMVRLAQSHGRRVFHRLEDVPGCA